MFKKRCNYKGWSTKDHGMCYSVCAIMDTKEPLLLIRKNSSPCSGGSGFPLSPYEWPFTICLPSLVIAIFCDLRTLGAHFVSGGGGGWGGSHFVCLFVCVFVSLFIYLFIVLNENITTYSTYECARALKPVL